MTHEDFAALHNTLEQTDEGDLIIPPDTLTSLLSALEEARRERDAARGEWDVLRTSLYHRAEAAEARADALQRERDEMEKSKWYERDRRKEAESRADAAWRAALEAAAGVLLTHVPDPSGLNESSDYQGGEVAEWVSEIRALPPPSATPNEET